MILWRRQGALEPLEEICKLAVNPHDNRQILATKLWTRLPALTKTRDALKYGVVHNNLPFVSWILKNNNPSYYSQAIKDSLALSQELNQHEMTSCFTNYIGKEKYLEARAQEARHTQNYGHGNCYDSWCP